MGTTAAIVLNTLRTLHPTGLPQNFKILELGATQIYGSRDDFAALAHYLGIGESTHLIDSMAAQSLTGNAAVSRDILAPAGVHYEAVDLNEFATLRLDLNYARVPHRHRGVYDLVTNFGTTEHILNQLNCFSFMHEATKVGGGMIHMVPMLGYMWHCLVKYDPKLFVMLADANHYEVVYAGFGPREEGTPVAEQCATWALNREVVGERPIDSRLVEIIFRKRRSAPFEPGFDQNANGYGGRANFPNTLLSIRERPCSAEPARVVREFNDRVSLGGRMRLAVQHSPAARILKRAGNAVRILGRAAAGDAAARQRVRQRLGRNGTRREDT